MPMALQIIADHQNVVGGRLALNYMRTPSTHCYLESSGQVTYMENHNKPTLVALVC